MYNNGYSPSAQNNRYIPLVEVNQAIFAWSLQTQSWLSFVSFIKPAKD